MKHKIYIAVGAVVVLSAVYLKHQTSFLPVGRVTIGGNHFLVEVAQSPSAREKGLSGKKRLGARQGMLFVFGERARHAFWMKDMKFPIDIVWIDGNKVVDIAPELPLPEGGGEPRAYLPRAEANFVLEVPAGSAKRLEWKIGDIVEIKY